MALSYLKTEMEKQCLWKYVLCPKGLNIYAQMHFPNYLVDMVSAKIK